MLNDPIVQKIRRDMLKDQQSQVSGCGILKTRSIKKPKIIGLFVDFGFKIVTANSLENLDK